MKQKTSDPTNHWPALSATLLHKAYARAQELNMSLSGYIKRLISQDIDTSALDTWTPVSQNVLDRWAHEIKQFEAEEKQGHHTTYHSLDELKADLDV